MSSKVVISSRFICHLFHTLRLPLCATTPHWTLILSHTYSYTLSHLYNPAFLQLSRTKSSKVQSKLPPSREDFLIHSQGSLKDLKCSGLLLGFALQHLCFCSALLQVVPLLRNIQSVGMTDALRSVRSSTAGKRSVILPSATRQQVLSLR